MKSVIAGFNCTYIGWFSKRFHLTFLVPSWFPRKKRILLWKAKTKCYLWASFHDIWYLSKSSKLDIQMAISAKQIMIWKIFLCKNKPYIVVVLVPNLYLSAWSSSFCVAFFLLVYGEPFQETPYIVTLRDKQCRSGMHTG